MGNKKSKSERSGLALRAWAPLLLSIGALGFAIFSGGLLRVFEGLRSYLFKLEAFESNFMLPTNSFVGRMVQRGMTSLNGPGSIDIVTRLDLHAGETMMEVGFGTGMGIREALLHDGVRVVGVDFSKDMIERAREELGDEVKGGRLRLHHAVARDMGFQADDSIDKVMHMNVLYFWDDPEASLREILRVMKPGGLMIGGTKIGYVRDRDPQMFKIRDIETYVDALKSVGFVDVYVQEVRLSTGCPGKHGKSGCRVDKRSHYEAIHAHKPKK